MVFLASWMGALDVVGECVERNVGILKIEIPLILYIFKIQWSWEMGIRFRGYFLVIYYIGISIIYNIGLYCASYIYDMKIYIILRS